MICVSLEYFKNVRPNFDVEYGLSLKMNDGINRKCMDDERDIRFINERSV